MRAVPVPAGGYGEAQSDRGPRQVCRAVPVADGRPDHAHPRQGVHLPRCDSHSHLSPSLSAAESLGQAGRLGGHEARSRHPDGRGLIMQNAKGTRPWHFASSAAVLVSVAVPVPFLDLLTYRVPDPMPAPVVGARVRVPVGSRVLTGVVVDTGVAASDYELKDVVAVLDC